MKKGRNVAQNMDMVIIGHIGVIRFLYRKEKISKIKIKEIVEKLSASSFRIPKKLMYTVPE